MTPTQEDEEFWRAALSAADMNDHVIESWKEDGGYRRPITLKAAEDSESEETRVSP